MTINSEATLDKSENSSCRPLEEVMFFQNKMSMFGSKLQDAKGR